MNIRRAKEQDMGGINNLLCQVLMIHHKGRPDLFKEDTKNILDDELRKLIHDDTKPIFVCVNENEEVLGYAFCIFQQHMNDNILDMISEHCILMIYVLTRADADSISGKRL